MSDIAIIILAICVIYLYKRLNRLKFDLEFAGVMASDRVRQDVVLLETRLDIISKEYREMYPILQRLQLEERVKFEDEFKKKENNNG